jgi:hypothetical protein
METIHLDPEVLGWEARLSGRRASREEHAGASASRSCRRALPVPLRKGGAVALNRAVDQRPGPKKSTTSASCLTGHNGSALSVSLFWV